MAFLRRRIITVLTKSDELAWLLLDRFHSGRSAGAVNGTAAEPGPGTRGTTETNGAAISVEGGRLKLIGSGSSYDHCKWGWTDSELDLTAKRGKAFFITMTHPVTAGRYYIWFTASHAWHHASSVLLHGGNPQVWTPTAGDTLRLGVIHRKTGLFFLVDGKLARVERTITAPFSFEGKAIRYYDPEALYADNAVLVELDTTDPTLYPTPEVSDTGDTPVITDYGDLELHGTPTSVGLNGSAGYYNGINSQVNILSSALPFSGVQGTVIARARVADSSVWTDSDYGSAIRIQVDGSNYIQIAKWNTNNTLNFQYVAGGTTKQVTKGSVSALDFMNLGLTWDKNAGASGEVKAFYDGAQEGSTRDALGVWAGALASAFIGITASSTYGWFGEIADVIESNVVATPAQMTTLHTALDAGTLTKATLDGIFGVNNYVWYKHDDPYVTNGLSHIEQSSRAEVTQDSNAFAITANKVRFDGTAGHYNGTDSYTNILSAELAAFDWRESTVIVRASNTSGWAAESRTLFHCSGGGRYIWLKQDVGGAGRFQWVIDLGGATAATTKTGQSSTGPTTWGFTISSSGDAAMRYVDGVNDNTLTGFGSTAMTISVANIGYYSAGGAWRGSIQDVILGNSVATPAQMATFHAKLAARTLTAADLDAVFGAGNYFWHNPASLALTSPVDAEWLPGGYSSSVTDSIASPAAGNTFEHDANFHFRVTVTTKGSAGETRIRFRDVPGVSNFSLRATPSTNKLQLRELISGVDTYVGQFDYVSGDVIDVYASGRNVVVTNNGVVKLGVTISQDTAQANGYVSTIETGGTYSNLTTHPPSANLHHNAAQKAYVYATGALGAELLTDGDMETAGVAAWTVGASATLTKEAGTPHGGSQCLRVAYNGVNFPHARQNVVLTNEFYRVIAWARGDGTVSPCVNLGSTLTVWTGTSSTSWQQGVVTARSTGADARLYALTTVAGYAEFDDCSIKRLPFPSLIRAVADSGQPYAGAALTIDPNSQAGIFINLDNPYSPLFGFMAMYDRLTGKVHAFGMVNGVLQGDSLAVTATYSAGKRLEMRRIGNTIYVFYNDAYIGSADATNMPTTNELSGWFATNDLNYAQSFESFDTSGRDYSAYD